VEAVITVVAAVELIKDVLRIHQHGGFCLRDFPSNSMAVLAE
jgi:hypothetical protein